MEIQEAREEDIEQISQIVKQIQSIHAEKRNEVFKSSDIEDIKEDIIEKMKKDEEKIFVAVENSEILGVMSAKIKITENHPNLKDSKVLWISEIGVKESKRNNGIGTQLLNKAKEIGKIESCDRIELNCWAFNESAFKFYDKQQFKEQRKVLEIKV